MVDSYLDASGDLEVIERLTDEFFKRYDPYLFVVDDATVMLERLSKRSRLFDAAKMRTARRLEKVEAHKEEGYKDAPSWLSAITGDSVGQAASKLETARSAEAHPSVSEALNNGNISEAQAKEISSAADLCPDEAAGLVAEAPLLTHGQLKRRCSEIRHSAESAEDEIARHERIRKSRFLRSWTDRDGAGHLQAKMTPDALAVILAGLGNFETAVFDEARRSGVRESHQAYLLDALVAMARASMTRLESCAPEDGTDDTRDPGSDARLGPWHQEAETNFRPESPHAGTSRPRSLAPRSHDHRRDL